MKGTDQISFLPRISITRPVTVAMLFLALLVIGYIAYTNIPYQLMPSGFEFPYLSVWIPYQNATPREVEEQIAKPIEEIMGTVLNINQMRTRSSSNGCNIRLRFNQNTDMRVAYNQVRDRIERIKPELPEDLDKRRIFLWRYDENEDPIIYMGVSVPPGADDPYYLVDTHFKRAIERIDGVAKVEIWGIQEKSVLIDVDHEKVKAYGIPFYSTVRQLMTDNFTMASGNVIDGGKKVYLRSMGKFQSLEEIGNLPIKGTHIRLKDVAEIRYDIPKRDYEQRIDRQQATLIGIFKESTANTVALCSVVAETIDDIFQEKKELGGFKHYILFDQGSLIMESINNLKNAAIWGSLFAILVLFLFTRQMRMTMIITLAIPISILASLIAVYFVGFSLNLLTMMGLMLCVGLVVDNSIVAVENIFRLRQQQLTAVEGAMRGASQIALAITMATLTTVVVFLPLILMNEDAGFSFYMWRIGFPVCMALVASLIVALLFIPLATTRFGKGARLVKEPRSITRLKEWYLRLLHRIITRRFDAALFVLLLVIIGFSSCSKIESTMEGQGHINDCWLIFDLPDNYTMLDARSLMTDMETTLYERQEEWRIRTVCTRIRKTFATMNVFFEKEESKGWYEDFWKKVKRKFKINGANGLTREEILEEMKNLDPKLPGVEMRVGWGREDSEDASLEISLYGDDTETLATLAEEVKRRLSTIPEILSIDTSIEEGGNEIQVTVDRELSRNYGIDTANVGNTVRYALGGIRLPDLRTQEREITTTIRMKEDDRETFEQLKNLSFNAGNGEEIPLGTLANFKMTRGFGNISRMDRQTQLTVKAITTEDKLETLYGEVSKKLADFEMPYGYSWTKGERYQRMQQDNESFQFALILAITFVFLLMGVLFESFLLPLAVIISIFFALTGVFLTLFITGTDLSLMAYIGTVILVGIVVNNAIVLLDLVNRFREEGMGRTEAIIEAGRHRFRPILMTTFTTIFGLVPMSLGNVNLIGIPYAPMGIAMMGGLAFSTFLTLLFVPLMYTLMDDLRGIFMNIITKNLLRRTKEPAGTLKA